MEFNQDSFYILVEGKPKGTEAILYRNIIQDLLMEGKIPEHNYEVFEVGGSSAFGSFAQRIYYNSSKHKDYPVLAIADRDYRLQKDIQGALEQGEKQRLIRDRNFFCGYLEVHEWENFLLFELANIIAFVDSLPTKIGRAGKPWRSEDFIPSIEELQQVLDSYFQEYFLSEFLNLLSFQIRQNPIIHDKNTAKSELKKILKLDGEVTLQSIREQFSKITEELLGTSYPKTDYTELLESVLAELPWAEWVDQEIPVDREIASTFFQGKEAFKHLTKWIKERSGIQNLSTTQFQDQLIRIIGEKKSSKIKSDIQRILSLVL